MSNRAYGRPRITQEQIGNIYLAFLADEPKLHIAARLNIDRKTVIKYIRKVEYLPNEHIHALIRGETPPLTCHQGHTALKCLLCGKTSDNIRTEEYQHIVRLRDRVRELEAILATKNEEPSHRPLSNPIVRITL